MQSAQSARSVRYRRHWLQSLTGPAGLRFITLIVGALLWSAPVRAQPIVVNGEAIAPLLPGFSPRQPVEIANRFQQALAEGVISPWTAVDQAQIRQKTQRGRGLMGCADATCVRAAQKALGVDYALVGQIDVVGKNYALEIAIHGRNKRLAAVKGRCDICTMREALNKTRELARKVARQASSLVTPRPVLRDRPPKVAPKMRRKKKRTPPAPATVRRPKAVPVAAPPSSDRWPLWPALAAAGAAAVGLGIGIPLLAVDGKGTDCRGEPRDDSRNCERIFSTAGGGWVMTSIGLASLAAAGVLVYLHLAARPEERPAAAPQLRQISVAPSARGVVFGAGGTF